MFSEQQRTEFETQGLVRLPQAIPVADAERVCGRIREHLSMQESINGNGGQGAISHLQPLTRAGVFDVVGEGRIPAALDELFGSGQWRHPRHWNRALVTFRDADRPWDVPSENWHVDRAPLPDAELPGVTVFVIFARLRPCGGGTMVLTGSHRLIQHEVMEPGPKNKQIRRSVDARHPWLRDLWGPDASASADRRRQFIDEGAVLDGIPVRVVELTGEPGDAFLMRADTFHTTAPNGLDEPRMMLAKTIHGDAPDIRTDLGVAKEE